VVQLLWMSSRVRLGQTSLSYRPKERKLALVVSVSAPFSTEQGGSREALPTWPDVRKSSTTIHHVVGPIDRRGDLHHRSVDSCAVAIWQISLASKAGRTRPPVVGGWPEPVLSSFVKANLESGTNFLRPDIRVGRVVASVGDPSLEMSLPFGRSDLQLFPSCSASVVGIDADGGSPDGDFTKECGGRVAARWCPDGLFTAVAGAVSDLICKAGNELRPLRQVLAPNVMIMKR
jgi:hypothetical protein